MASDKIACRIPLSKGLIALVSPQDYAVLAAHRWASVKGGRTQYAQRIARDADGRRSALLMHRMIMAPPPGMVVDHINGDGLDNRRENLRLCTHAENIRNQQIRRGSKSSRFKGVWWQRGKWAAMIEHDGDKICLGRFDCEEQAARQYDRAARIFFGSFARTNGALGLFDQPGASPAHASHAPRPG